VTAPEQTNPPDDLRRVFASKPKAARNAAKTDAIENPAWNCACREPMSKSAADN